MDEIEKLADLSIKRGCAFGTLAISTLMTGLSGMPLIALKSGAISFTMMAAILALRAHLARRGNCRRTEVWAMLGPDRRPPLPQAQRLIGDILYRTYWRYTELAAGVALLIWLIAIAFWALPPHR